jgi:hypothetical protein
MCGHPAAGSVVVVNAAWVPLGMSRCPLYEFAALVATSKSSAGQLTIVTLRDDALFGDGFE